MDDPILLTIPQACARLNLGRSKVYQLVANGDLSMVRIGRAARIHASVVNAYVAKLQDDAASESYPDARTRDSAGNPTDLSNGARRRAAARAR